MSLFKEITLTTMILLFSRKIVNSKFQWVFLLLLVCCGSWVFFPLPWAGWSGLLKCVIFAHETPNRNLISEIIAFQHQRILFVFLFPFFQEIDIFGSVWSVWCSCVFGFKRNCIDNFQLHFALCILTLLWSVLS